MIPLPSVCELGNQSERERERCRSQTDGCDNVTFVIGKTV